MQTMLSIFSMGKKTDHPAMYQQQQQPRASLSSAWGVDLLPPTTQETTVSYSLETVSETRPPVTFHKQSPYGKGREGLLNSQYLNAAQGEKEGDHTVVEVSSVQEQGVIMDKSSAASLVESTSNIIMSEQRSTEQQNTLTLSGSQLEPAVDESKNTLVIKNLPFKFKQADLDKILSDNQAKPKNVRLLRDDSGRFTGIAFVRCPSKDEASRLISNMNGMDVGGRAIQVEFKKKKSKKKQQQQQQKLTMSGSSLASSGDSDRWSIDSDETPGRRLAFSDEILQQVSPPSSNIAPTYAMMLEKPVKKLSISDEHTITDKYLRRSANDVQQNQMAAAYLQQQSNPFQSSSLFSNPPQMPTELPAAQPQYYPTPFPYPMSKYSDNVDYQQARRKSFSVVEGRAQQHPNYYVPPGNRRSLEETTGPTMGPAWNFYPRSAVPRSLTTSDPANNLKYVSVRPLRQPYGPDGKTKGFSFEYQLSRKSLLTSPSNSASLPTFAPSLHPY